MRTDFTALDFTRTRGWEARDRSDDELTDYAGVLRWCERRGVLGTAEARRFARAGRARPRAAQAAARRARALREVAYRVLRTLGTGGMPDQDALREVAGWVNRYAAVRQLDGSATGIDWRWEFDPRHLDQPLAPVAWSLAELLVAPEASRVRLCEGDDCGWLFIDASRAGSRRWCTMADCGNLMKVRRHRSRSAG